MPWRRLITIAAAGAIAVALSLAIGTTVQRVRWGSDLAEARTQVEVDVRRTFNEMAQRLRQMGTSAGSTPADVRAAADGDATAARRLFDRTARTVAPDASADVAITIYADDGHVLAWAGRPSELVPERLRGGESWFIAQGALGLRLVYVMPVGDPPARSGVVVSERALTVDNADGSPGLPAIRENRFRLPGRLVPVSIELPFEGARAVEDVAAFEVRSPADDPLLTAIVNEADIRAAQEETRRATRAVALCLTALTLLLLTGPLLDWRAAVRDPRRYVGAVLAVGLLVLGARAVVLLALSRLASGVDLLSENVYGSAWLRPLLSSPLDFLLTLLAASAVMALLLFALEAWRRRPGDRGHRPVPGPTSMRTALLDLATGFVVAVVLVAYGAFLNETVTHTSIDVLRFSLWPWNSAAMAVHVGLIVAHGTVLALGVLLFRAVRMLRRRPRSSWTERTIAATCWTLPLLVVPLYVRSPVPLLPLLVPLGTAVGLALLGTRLTARYRRGSQAFRLALVTLGLIGPALTFYPAMFHLARAAKTRQVETRYAEQARNQRQSLQTQLRQALGQIDRIQGLADIIGATPPPGDTSLTDRAFQVWQTTSLASSYPVTSSVELYGRNGALVSRFAFNLPDDLSAPPRSQERACDWELYGEVAPFFAEERRVLHAGRTLCTGPTPATSVGSIVVHAMLDYENLPFIASGNPYVELLRPRGNTGDRRVPGGDIEYAVYGWSRTPLYASRGTAWTLDDAAFTQLEHEREPFWTTLNRDAEPYSVYLMNDRGGIYALGFPVVPLLGHSVNLAELTVLGAVVALVLLAGGAAFGFLTRRRTSAQGLLLEVRASFYRKLFLAFVLAVAIPVILLAAVTRTFIAEQMRASVEREALRTAFAASRVVQDLVAPRVEQRGAIVDDNLMVWVSRLIDEDSNIFVGTRLVATSERNLFASGLLPTRAQADVYRALELDRQAATVAREQVGGFEYLVAAAPLTIGADQAVLTVPLTSRQRDIDVEIDALDRRVLLVALLLVLGGAGLGYSMAERIADPVSRLTRATRRIARGDLDARILTTSSDEFRQLVDDFNRMADQLQRQRTELERTNRLEAWAEMARQVAHEIKNPLTPIQLNAEHLRRVHADRGEPMGAILRDCVETILTQVTLLRRIASEFSTFASSPTARPTVVDVAEMLRDVVEPYRAGLDHRLQFDIDIAHGLPAVSVDRTLVSRAITNVVENALHAMPGAGTLQVAAWADAGGVHVRVGDTGSGMDAEALARAFEPYFSTKAAGTGLGLPIAKRNVELNGGTLHISSQRDQGTVVELVLPSHAVPDTAIDRPA